METRQLKKMRWNRRLLRIIGAFFSLVAGMMLVALVPLVLNPNRTIIYNGQPTTDSGVKLAAMLVVFTVFAVGLGLLFAPSRFLSRLLVWQLRQQRQQRQQGTLWPVPKSWYRH